MNNGSSRGPIRTCIGCRQTDDQAVLLRLAQESGSTRVVPDPQRRKTGRGAWVHRDPECVRRAVSRNAANRAFRAQVVADEEELLAVINLGTTRVQGSTMTDQKAG